MCCCLKRKTEAEAILRTNGTLSFVRLFTKKQMEVIHLQTDETNWPVYENSLPMAMENNLLEAPEEQSNL
jgi:hypothetical protein